MSNYIGPITTEKVHIRDGNETKRDGSETINLVCSVEQAHQLRGLCENSVKNTYGALRVLNTQESRWGIVPVNTSENLKVNEHQTHSGLYHVKDLEIEAIGNRDDIVIARIPVELLSKNVNEILTILHSRGGEDGSSIEMSEEYSDEEIEFLLEEEFTTFNTTTVWHPKYTENMATGADIVASGGKLVFSGASATNLTWSYLWTVLRETLPDDFEAEFTLEWNALPASGAVAHHINLFLMDGKPANSTELQYKDTLRMVLDVQDTGAVISVDKRIRGNYSGISADHSLTSSQKIIALKIKLEGGTGVSKLTVWIDKNYIGTGTPSYGDPIFGPANTGFNYDNEMYLILAMENASSTSATVRCSYLNISQTFNALRPNTVVAPIGAVLDQSATFTRTGSEGAIPCIKNPSAFPTLQVTPANFFKGHVKAWNGNYEDGVSRLVTDNEFDLDPSKFFVSNGLIQLVTWDNFVSFGYWDGTGWQNLNTFTFPTDILLIRPFLVTPWTFILQIDRTLWTMRAGKPHIWVYHPTTPLGFIRKSAYDHDGTTTLNPTANADVSMSTVFHCEIYDDSPLSNFTDALARLDSGSDEIIHVNVIGDSITEGKFAGDLSSDEMFTYGFLGLLRSYYQDLYGDVGRGLIPSVYHVGVANCPWSFSTSPAWSHGDNWIAGVGGSTYYTSNENATVEITFEGTGFNLLYVKGNGYGVFEYQIDGGSPTTVDCQNSVTLYSALEEITGLSNDTHTLTITKKNNDGKSIYLIGGYETKTLTNIFDENVETGTDTLGNTTGFTSYGATITSSDTWAKKGSKSLKIVTNNSVAGEGAYATFTSIPGEDHTVQFTIKGTAGNTYRIYLRNNAAGAESFISPGYETFTLTSDEETLTYTGICPAGVTTGRLMVTTHTQRSENIYLDEIYGVYGVEIPDTAGVQVNCCGESGSTAYGHSNEGPMQTEIDHFEPTLTIIALGANDYGTQVAISDFRTRIQTLITRAKTYGDVIIMPLGMQEAEYSIPYSDYEDVLKELAELNNCLHVDVNAIWENYDNAKNVLEYIYDTLHPNTAGHNSIYTILTDTIDSGDQTDTYGLQIISPDPRTIKSDSIPASELTGIGVYDSTIAVDSDDSYLYRAREWFEPTWQTLLFQSEV